MTYLKGRREKEKAVSFECIIFISLLSFKFVINTVQCCYFFNVDAREMLEYNKQGQTFQRGMMGKHLGVKSILGLDVDDMATSHMTNMYWSSDFYRKLACVKQYHSAERSVSTVHKCQLSAERLVLYIKESQKRTERSIQ